MLRFRKKPVDIEAMQLTPQSLQSCALFVGERIIESNAARVEIVFTTASGPVRAKATDWICRQRIAGHDLIDVWPVAADIFAATYEPIIEQEHDHGGY